MLHPSYSDLMKVVNSEVEPGEAPVVNSRYSIVMATSKRARQIIAGDEPMVKAAGKKPLSVAIEELNQSKIRILSEEEAEQQRKQMEEMRERFARVEAAMGSYAPEKDEAKEEGGHPVSMDEEEDSDAAFTDEEEDSDPAFMDGEEDSDPAFTEEGGDGEPAFAEDEAEDGIGAAGEAESGDIGDKAFLEEEDEEYR